MIFDLPPKDPQLWLPPKPAIIRPVGDLFVPRRQPLMAHRMRRAVLTGPTGPVEIADDGDFAPSSGTGSSTHTYNSRTSTGPKTIICLTHLSGGGRSVSSVTWNGNTVDILYQDSDAGSGSGAAILGISGAQSGNLVCNFSDTVTDSEITILSLSNLSSFTPEDTDTGNSNFGTSSLMDNLVAPSEGGCRIAVFCHLDPSAAAVTWSWTGHTEAADVDAGSFWHSVAYETSDTGGDITASYSGTSGGLTLIGVSLR